VKEIVLTGVNLVISKPPSRPPPKGKIQGKPLNEREENFFELIKELENVKGIQRYRISSIEPNLLTKRDH
jgi:threonylcarbamoyladenosine tRNA methylthiotransferase MtaB